MFPLCQVELDLSTQSRLFTIAGELGWDFPQPQTCCWREPEFPSCSFPSESICLDQPQQHHHNPAVPKTRKWLLSLPELQTETNPKLALQALTCWFPGSEMGQDTAETSAIDLCITAEPANNCLFENPLSPPPP